MRRVLKFGCRTFVGLTVVLLVSVLLVACSDLPGSGPTVTEPSTGSTGADGTTSLFTTTYPPSSDATTSTTAGPVETLPPVTTLPPAATTSTTGLSSAEELLPSGHIKAMGFIDRVWVDGGVRYIRIDYAVLFNEGAEATAAARADGEIGPTEEWDGPYISNVNPLKRTFAVSNSVAITTSTRWVPGEDMGAPCTWADFRSFWGPGPFPESEGHLHDMPWWIERDGDTVVKIDEQYLP